MTRSAPYQATGHLRNARDAWRQALAILDDMRHPDAGQVRSRLGQPSPIAGPPA